ncbi:MAG: pyruvate formate lyase family protein [Victivallales bacterium]
MSISIKMPAISERISILRERCLDRKAVWGNFPNWKAVVDAEVIRKTENVKSWQLRMGMRTKARLQNIKFETDELELLAGRVSFEDYKYSKPEISESEKYLSNYKWPGGQTGHCAMDMSRIFKVGIKGILSELKKKLKSSSGETRKTYQSFIFAVEGLSDMIENAKLAAEKAMLKAPEWRKKELVEMVDSCGRTQTEPPKTYRDAIQLIWFVDMGISYSDNAGLVVPGHLDRELIGFYNADVKKGILSKEKALNLIECLYILINNFVADGGAVSVMAGGTDAEGRDVTNDLSYLSLEALRRTKLVYPTVGICWHEGTPESLSMHAAELISKGYSTPAFFGDKIIQKGLKSYGLNRKQACNYINSTCVEITPVGCSNVWVASPYFSLCKILLDEIDVQASASKPARSFESFLSSYYKRLGEKIKSAAATENKTRDGRRKYGGKPLQSVFTKSCIESGRDIDNGGADVNWIECSFVGVANLADALHVIHNEVFISKNMDFSGLKKILDSDFKGQENVRLRFLDNYEKYGNNCGNVDSIVHRTADFIKKECGRHKVNPGKTHFIPGAFCWIMHERLGSECGATPDGRRKGLPFADGGGPAQGREKNGPTSSILSATSWDHSFLIGGLAYNMKFSGELFDSPEAVKRLYALIATFLKRGGFETQINVISRKTLEEAKKNPEQYRDLVVRIGGYTDYFTRLSPEMKEEVMLRTEYREL